MTATAQTGPPDFIGVGTLDSGMSWWHDMLLRHPELEPRHKDDREVHFFDQFCARPMTDEDVAAYHRSFPRSEGRITGEWTARYIFDAWTPPLLKRAAPDAKLLVMLCDPVERYRRRLARQLVSSKRTSVMYLPDAARRGRYAPQLRALESFYDKDRILVLQFERCRADPLGEYERTLRFLGVKGPIELPRALRRQQARGFGPIGPVRAVRATAPGRFLIGLLPGRLRNPGPADLWPDMEASLHDELDSDVAALEAIVPDLDVSLWPNFAHLATATRTA